MKDTNKSRSRSRKNLSIRQRIVDAARAHFFSHGFRSVTMDDLAEELGISKKTLYAYFPGKFDLLEAVLADKLTGVEATLKEVTRAHPDDFPATCASYWLARNANWMRSSRRSCAICARKRPTSLNTSSAGGPR